MTLKEWRVKHGLSLRAAGALLGVSHIRVTQYERGNSPPLMSTVDRIEAATKGEVTRMDWPKVTP